MDMVQEFAGQRVGMKMAERVKRVKSPRLFAAIDIGSHKLKMKIVEACPEGEIRTLDTVDRLIPLGRDTFNDGKLSFDSVKRTCEAIQSFKRLMTDYGVKEWRMVATSAIREAENRDYMIDRIRLQTDFDTEIINNSQEKFLTYKAIKWQVDNHKAINTNDPTLILNISAGSIQLLLTENNLLVSSQSLKLGALRIKESIARLEKHPLNFTRVLEEYIGAHIENVEYLKSTHEITNFVIVSGELEYILSLLGKSTGGVTILSRDDFEEIYDLIIHKTTRTISEEYGIPYADAELFVPSLLLIREFFGKTSSDKIVIPNVSLVDGMIVERFNGDLSNGRYIDFDADTLSYVRNLADRYRYNKRHCEYVEHAALQMFDKLKPVHGLGERERFLLQIACVLHDIGKFIGADPHFIHSYNIINASQLLGLSDDELWMVSSIARYHSIETPSFSSAGLNRMEKPLQIKTMKLIAIIRMADALDTSHKQKLRIKSLAVREDQFEIITTTREETVLEYWTFQMKAEFFTEVYGLKPQLVIQNSMAETNL